MSRWKSSLAGSLLINCLLLTGGAVYLNYSAPEADAKPEPVEIEIVSDAGSPNAPQIAAPQQKKVDIPPPPTPEQIQQVKDGLPVEQALKEPVPNPNPNPNPTPNPVDPNLNPDSNPGGPGNPGNPDPEPEEDLSRGPRVTYSVNPSYGAKKTLVGRVEWTLNASGDVVNVRIEESTGDAGADEAMVEAAWQWTFLPATDSKGNPKGTTINTNITIKPAGN